MLLKRQNSIYEASSLNEQTGMIVDKWQSKWRGKATWILLLRHLKACLIIGHVQLLSVMKDERSPYYYLPGGRVALHETAERACCVKSKRN
jgi:hypothetical protein